MYNAIGEAKSLPNFLNVVKESCGLKDFLGSISEDKREKVINRLNKDASGKAMKVGVAFGGIALLAVGGECFAAGAALPILAIIGIVVAAAAVAGVTAYGITYAMLKPSNELGKINIHPAQETELKNMSNGKSCHSIG